MHFTLRNTAKEPVKIQVYKDPRTIIKFKCPKCSAEVGNLPNTCHGQMSRCPRTDIIISAEQRALGIKDREPYDYIYVEGYYD